MSGPAKTPRARGPRPVRPSDVEALVRDMAGQVRGLANRAEPAGRRFVYDSVLMLLGDALFGEETAKHVYLATRLGEPVP